MAKPDIHIRKTQTDKTRLEESLTLRDDRPVFSTGVLKLLIKNTVAQRERKLSHNTIKILM